MVIGWIQFSVLCHNHYQDVQLNCASILIAYQSAFWYNFFISVLIQIYFAHVCKLYANLADPANPNAPVQQDLMNGGQQAQYQAYPAPAAGPYYVQPGQAAPVAYQATTQYQMTADGTTETPYTAAPPVYMGENVDNQPQADKNLI